MLKFKYSFRFYFLLLVVSVISNSCSTKKNTAVSRAYHNLNSHYNGFYYATESLNEGAEKVKKNRKEDYDNILPVYIYPTKEESKSILSDMDRAIEKSSKVIQRHAITDKRDKEIIGAVKWIDDNYMVIAQAQFYKNDYITALEIFEYVAKSYKQELNHYKAYLWMLRCYTQLGSYSSFETTSDMLKSDKNFPKSLSSEFAAITAHYHLLRERYSYAVKELTKASAYTNKRKERVRYTYILAQLYQKDKNPKKALLYYKQVLKMNPTYEMGFNAKINIAKLYDSHLDEGKKIRKDFTKMLKEEKNAEYKDQIYYAIAQIDKKEGKISSAINNLNKSVRASVDNKKQKAISFLDLGDIYLKIPDYINAQINYDSAIYFLDKSYPNYEAIVNKQKSLNKLVTNLNTIALEDSLQKLSKLSEKERNKIIDKLISKLEQEEKEKQEKANQESSTNNSNTSTNKENEQTGLWYFYNPVTVTKGVADFVKRWGDRKYEDNWRRSNKEIELNSSDNNTNSDTSSSAKNTSQRKSTTKNREYYISKIPFNSEQIEQSNIKMIDAYYEAGLIYKEDLDDSEKSIETFNELLKRFPENKYTASVYFYLYRLYLSLDEEENADKYKKLLLDKYPDTEYARILKNPDYAKKNKKEYSKIELLYTEAYQNYNEENYSEVIRKCSLADTLYYKNALMPKFDLLKSMAIGKLYGSDAFAKALKKIILDYPKNEVAERAQEFLDYIDKSTTKQSNKNDSIASIFSFDSTKEHYWILILPKDSLKGTDAIKKNLADINSSNFRLENLSITTTTTNQISQLILVKPFNNSDKAIKYYDFVKSSNEFLTLLKGFTYQHYIISSSNYADLVKNNNYSAYQDFFKKHYLN